MSTTVIVIMVAGACFALYQLFFARRGEMPTTEGAQADVGRYLDALLEAGSQSAFLVVELAGGEDFVQFAKDGDELRLNFPLANKRQNEQEGAVRAIAATRGFEPTTGKRALDYAVGKDSERIGLMVGRMFQDAFHAEPEARLCFKAHGFELPNDSVAAGQNEEGS